jgi:hypothetical protein
VQEPPDAGGGLAGAGRAFEEEFALDRHTLVLSVDI